MLKSAEGAAKFMKKELKDLFSGFAGTLAGALVLKKIKSMQKRLDVKEIGGAPILGSAKCVVKAHGQQRRESVCKRDKTGKGLCGFGYNRKSFRGGCTDAGGEKGGGKRRCLKKLPR